MLATLLAAAIAAAASPPAFRVDYFHTGNATEERFALDRLVLEPLPFPGNPARPLDETNLGKYLFEVRDLATGRLLYARGFASIYGEWETTPEAKERHRTFHESLRFPRPAAPVQVVVKKRDARNLFREVWTLAVDAADPAVDPSPPASPGPVIEILRSGPPEAKLDLLLLCDGYTAAERGKCEKDARRLTAALLAQPPFRERKADLNVWALAPPAAERGVSRPSTGLHRASPLGASYDAFGSERYVLTFENRRVREAASFAPYDALAILVNGETYGGGGIFGLYATVAADSRWAEYIFVHELGHSLAGLADEYFTSPTSYLPAADRVEPWERNATALLDPAHLKWKALATPGVPIPTPWRAEAFTARSREFQAERQRIRAERRPEADMDALFLAEQKEETAFLAAEPHAREVGAFEGAMYEAKGYYRPQADCIMFTRNPVPFCAVCRAALTEILDLYSRGK
ncbi:MAG TPA: IgA Peptidase M64 [Anaeromyxobacteraceae bacterium]|nr:IgA Peptidase M64 [Anaeromyxobacteraceae bacterium]